MKATGSCARCGAVLASDQEYCLECGARRPHSSRSPWRTPLIAAVVTAALALAALLFAYQQMRDDAEGEAKAGSAEQGRVTGSAPASAQAAGPGALQQSPSEPSGPPPIP